MHFLCSFGNHNHKTGLCVSILWAVSTFQWLRCQYAFFFSLDKETIIGRLFYLKHILTRHMPLTWRHNELWLDTREALRKRRHPKGSDTLQRLIKPENPSSSVIKLLFTKSTANYSGFHRDPHNKELLTCAVCERGFWPLCFLVWCH